MWTHCLNSVRLLPSRTTSWAFEPLYWTTLRPDSLAANWKEKHCIVTVGFGLCVQCLWTCVFLCQHFCVPPILTNYIQTGRGESLERHKSELQTHRHNLSFTLSNLRSVFKHFLTSLKNTFHNIVGIILNKQHNPKRSNVGYSTEVRKKNRWIWNTVQSNVIQRKTLPWLAGLWSVCLWWWWWSLWREQSL